MWRRASEGLANTQVKVGQFDQALTNYQRALDLSRKAGDTLGAAGASYGMATLWAVRAVRGRARRPRRCAEDVPRCGDKRWLADALNGYASTLVMLGRSAPARESLKEASAHCSRVEGCESHCVDLEQ